MSQPIRDLNEIDTETQEGQLLMAALVIITTSTEYRTKTPFDVIEELHEISEKNNKFQPTWEYKELLKVVKGGKDDTN